MRWLTRLRAAILLGSLLELSACVEAQSIPVAPTGQSSTPAAAQPSQPSPTAQQEPAPTAAPETVQPIQLTATAYLNAVRKRVMSHLQYPESFRRDHVTGTAEFAVIISRDGDIIACRLLRSSGNAAVDDVGEQAIRQSSPLPLPPPSILRGNIVTLHAKVTVEPDHPESKGKAAQP